MTKGSLHFEKRGSIQYQGHEGFVSISLINPYILPVATSCYFQCYMFFPIWFSTMAIISTYCARTHLKPSARKPGGDLGVSRNWGYLIGGPNNQDYSIWGSILGSPYFGKLPLLGSPYFGKLPLLGSPYFGKLPFY